MIRQCYAYENYIICNSKLLFWIVCLGINFDVIRVFCVRFKFFCFLFVCVRLFKVFKKIHCKNLLIATNQDFNIFFKVINVQTSTGYRCWKRKRPQKQKLEAQPFILPKFEFSLVNRRLVVIYRHSILLPYHLIERLVFIVSPSGSNIQDVSNWGNNTVFIWRFHFTSFLSIYTSIYLIHLSYLFPG